MKARIDQYYSKRYKTKRSRVILFSSILFLIPIIAGFAIASSTNQTIFFLFLAISLGASYYFSQRTELRIWKSILSGPIHPDQKEILLKHIEFYRNLDDHSKLYFEQRIRYFLQTKSISGVDCKIDEKIQIFVASSAIMPIFSFPEFFYRNINEILIYPDSFDESYNISDANERKRIAGMVGNGAMNRMMILSKRDLLKAFDDRIVADNVAIHEFVHLIDMADGSVDGIPRVLLEKSYTLPWIGQVKREMDLIKHRKSDIDKYALTNPSEFLAVVSEYFFDSPERFMERHPKLYDSMSKIFKYNS